MYTSTLKVKTKEAVNAVTHHLLSRHVALSLVVGKWREKKTFKKKTFFWSGM
jgi:hypothetical protein